ncbi:DUF1007 family protein [Qingshengfaniella alkalisoli]|nr:DUF1007 family protein [Qingshengfaniella alkalisoli]
MKSLVAALVLPLFASPATAHPHVFVEAEGVYIFDADGGLAGVKIDWLYDAFSTLVLYDTLDLDRDGDGQLNDDDLEKIKLGETDWPPDYEGDTYLWIDGQKQNLSRPHNASAYIVDDQVGVTFELYLDNTVNVSGLTASLKLYDPYYYYAYSVSGAGQTGDHGTECQVSVKRFTPDEEETALQRKLAALSREEMPQDENIGALFAEEIVLQCD